MVVDVATATYHLLTPRPPTLLAWNTMVDLSLDRGMLGAAVIRYVGSGWRNLIRVDVFFEWKWCAFAAGRSGLRLWNVCVDNICSQTGSLYHCVWGERGFTHIAVKKTIGLMIKTQAATENEVRYFNTTFVLPDESNTTIQHSSSHLV